MLVVVGAAVVDVVDVVDDEVVVSASVVVVASVVVGRPTAAVSVSGSSLPPVKPMTRTARTPR